VQIYVSANGYDFGTPVATGTWADDATDKTVKFAAVNGAAVRLTALTEAGGRGPWSSMADINLIGTVVKPSPPGGGPGSWGPLINFPLVPVAAAMLANGNVRAQRCCARVLAIRGWSALRCCCACASWRLRASLAEAWLALQPALHP
jgi:hypothetical protein